MAEADHAPWLTLVGWGESGITGLTSASRTMLEQAEIIFGARRHLSLLPDFGATTVEWPVPFSDGIPLLMAERGRRVVMLVSGDPFWFGAGSVLAKQLGLHEWQALPSPSAFSLAAAALGWSLEQTRCLGLHAAPLTRIRPHLQSGRQLLVLLRDGEATIQLADRLCEYGFGTSQLHILEALGGERERIRSVQAGAGLPSDIVHPVAVAVSVKGQGPALPCTPGLPDHFFEHDGQITKQAVRTLTLAALAPCPGERLWDIGTGSGSVAIEWLLSHPDNQAIAFERSAERAQAARRNATNLGVDWLAVEEGSAPAVLTGQAAPDAVFIGGGLSESLLTTVWTTLEPGTRLVCNAVTLESEALLAHWHANKGGDLLRLELADASAMGQRRGWKSRYPIVQWKVVL